MVQTTQNKPHGEKPSFGKSKTYTYHGKEVNIITLFADLQVAIVQDGNGSIFDVCLDELQ